MKVFPFVLEYAFYGMCLGAVIHIQVYFMSKGLNWVADALSGEKLKE